jgi:tetratricopeptide (TPR) repeat protein
MLEKLDDDDKLYLSAVAAVQKEDYSNAIEILSSLVEKNPSDFDSLLLLAECYEKVDDPIQALLALKAAQKLEPQNAKLLVNLGIIYSRLFLHELTTHVLKQALELGEVEENTHSSLAFSYFRLNNMDEAVKICKKGLLVNASWNGLRYFLGMTYLYIKNTPAAITIAEELKTTNDPRAPQLIKIIEEDDPEKDKINKIQAKHEARDQIHELEERMKKGNLKTKDAVTILTSALQLDDELAIAYTMLGKMLDDCGLIDEGLSLHKRAIELDPALSVAYNNLGYVLQVKRNYLEAIQAYEMALQLDPNKVQAHNSIGCLYDNLGNYEKGLSHFLEALKIDPSRIITIQNLGWVYTALGRFEEALEVYKKYADLYPGEIEPNLGSAKIYREMGRYDIAANEYLLALQINPESLQCWLELGECYAEMGEKEKLQEVFQKLFSLFPRSPEEMFKMAEVMEKIDTETSAKYWRNYLSVAEVYPLPPDQVAYAKERLASLLGPTN